MASCEFSFFLSGTAAEAVFEVVVQDEIQLLRCEPVVFRQHRVDFVEDGLEVLNADGAAVWLRMLTQMFRVSQAP